MIERASSGLRHVGCPGPLCRHPRKLYTIGLPDASKGLPSVNPVSANGRSSPLQGEAGRFGIGTSYLLPCVPAMVTFPDL